jgi:hypothetical protein
MTGWGGEPYVWEQRSYNTRTGDGPNDLRDEDHSEACVGDAADERETESHGWVEQATRDTEEDPSVDSETEAERQWDVHQRAESWRGSGIIRVVGSFSFVRDLGTSEREEQEEKCAEELANSLRRVSSLMRDAWVWEGAALTATTWLRTGCGWPLGTSDGLRPVSKASRWVALGRTMRRSWTGGWTFMAAVVFCFF